MQARNGAAVDVRDRAALEEVIAGLPDLFSHPTILVNNAGLALGLDKAQTADGDDWDAMIDTNVRGFAHLARLVLKKMVAEGRGHIVNMGSVAGSYPYPGGNVYGATKSFVEQFSLNLRADLLGTPIRVTNIEPGMVETNFSRVRYRGDNAKADALYKDLQVLSPEDIAGIVRWVTEQPAHVNVNRLEVMSVAQSFSPFTLDRKPTQ